MVRKPKRLDEDILLCEFIDERHDVLRRLDAFLDMSSSHRVWIPGPAAQVGEVVEQK